MINFVLLLQMKYSEYDESKGKGSFPAMITPGYQAAKNANTLASSVSNMRAKNWMYLCDFRFFNFMSNLKSKPKV